MEGEELEVKRRREDEETAKVVAELEARLEASEERADEAEAKAEAMKTKARLHSNRLFKSLARAQKRIDEIETSKTTGASSSTIILGGRGGGDGGRHRGHHQRAGRAESSSQA